MLLLSIADARAAMIQVETSRASPSRTITDAGAASIEMPTARTDLSGPGPIANAVAPTVHMPTATASPANVINVVRDFRRHA